jgi:hypothetical protein
VESRQNGGGPGGDRCPKALEGAGGPVGVPSRTRLGVRWLWFSDRSGLPGMVPVALRLPDDFLPPAEQGADDRPIGFYL